MPKPPTPTPTVMSILRPAARAALVALVVLVGALVGLTAFGAISPSTAAGVLCGALVGGAIAIGGAVHRMRSSSDARGSAATRRSEVEDAAVLDRLEPLDREVR